MFILGLPNATHDITFFIISELIMKNEIESVVNFLTRLFHQYNITEYKIHTVKKILRQKLYQHCKFHWFPDHPYKNECFRCIRIHHQIPSNPILNHVFQICNISYSILYHIFPHGIILWLNPNEVSYRIGEKNPVYYLYKKE